MPQLCAVRGAADMPYALQRNRCMPLYALLAESRVCQNEAIAGSRGSSGYAQQRNRWMPSLYAASGSAGTPNGVRVSRGSPYLGVRGIAGESLVWGPRYRGGAHSNALGSAESRGSPCKARRVSSRNREGKAPLRAWWAAEPRHHRPLAVRISACGCLYSDERGGGESKVTCTVPFARANFLYVSTGIRGGPRAQLVGVAHTRARGGYPPAGRQRAFTSCPRYSILGPPRLG